VNVLFLLLTSVSAGDAVHAAPPAAGPVVSTPIPGGCGAGGGCGATCDSCGSDCCAKPSFCDRLKAKFRKSSTCCEATCAPTCAAPACAAPACAPACAAPACATASCGSTCDSCCHEKKPSFFDKLKAKCAKKGSCCPETCDTCGAGYAGAVSSGCSGCAPAASAPITGVPAAMPSPGAPIIGVPVTPEVPGKAIEPIKKMPKDEGKGASLAPVAPTAPVTPAGARIETEVKNPFELARRYEKRVAHAADYSRLTGQLSFVHADGGLWVLRYAPLAEEDQNGGSVILARDRMMNNYHEGDLVSIEGQVISQKGSARLGGPLYRVQSISLVDRPLK
jgi:hypothetical protein